MNAIKLNRNIKTAGGKITCPRCQAHSKRTKLQCGAPAERGKRVCRFHGARSSGPVSPEGRLRIAHSKTKHGNETRQARADRSIKSAELSSIEDMMYLTGMTKAPRTRGRKAASYEPIKSLDAAFDFMATHLITP